MLLILEKNNFSDYYKIISLYPEIVNVAQIHSFANVLTYLMHIIFIFLIIHLSVVNNQTIYVCGCRLLTFVYCLLATKHCIPFYQIPYKLFATRTGKHSRETHLGNTPSIILTSS